MKDFWLSACSKLLAAERQSSVYNSKQQQHVCGVQCERFCDSGSFCVGNVHCH